MHACLLQYVCLSTVRCCRYVHGSEMREGGAPSEKRGMGGRGRG